MFIHNGTSREDMPQCITGNRRVKMLPMNQILAHGMSPVHISPYGAVWIILKIKVIFTVFINQSVGIIHPAIKRSVMINRTELIPVCRIKCIRNPDAVPTQRICRHLLYNDSSFLTSLRQGKRNIIFNAVCSQTHIHIGICGAPSIQPYQSFLAALLNRKQQIFSGTGNMYDCHRISLMFENQVIFL